MRTTLILASMVLCSRPAAGQRLLFPEPAARVGLVDYEPSWSPDGSRLAFISNRTGAFKVYIGWIDSVGMTRLTEGTAEDDSPAWSPDGSQIAFVSTRDGNPEIYRMNADGSAQVRLTNDPGVDIHPIWSGDGRSILWNSSRSSRNAEDPETFEVFAMDADGGGVRRLTTGGVATYASWSPDGTRLLYRRQVADGNSVIVIADRDGVETRLTQDPSRDGWPAWSPDGRRVVFAREDSSGAAIMVIGDDGSGLTRISTGPGRWTNPRWSPTGNWIVASRREGRQVRLYLLPVPSP